MTSRYDKDVIFRRMRKRRRQRHGGDAGDRFLNIYLWVFIFLAAALVMIMGVWLFV